MKANLNIIEDKRKKIGIPKAELARRCDVRPDTMAFFLKRGNQLNKDLSLVSRLCSELKIPIERVIK
jgi:DNA-binding XRE family transcriptional regulator